MEVRVRERLVGALVLVAIVVLVVPAILKGRGNASVEPPAGPTRREELPLVDPRQAPEEQVLVPEPVADPPASPAGETQAPPQAPADPPPAAKVAPVAAPTVVPAAAPRVKIAAAEPATPAAASQAPAWAVQLGAFSNRAKAEQLVAELKKRRYAAFMLEYRASGQVLYRVRVGPEQDRARADEIAARLAKDGFQPVVARHP
jgi:DedD protein